MYPHMQVVLICFIYEFENTDICSFSFTLDLTFALAQKLFSSINFYLIFQPLYR